MISSFKPKSKTKDGGDNLPTFRKAYDPFLSPFQLSGSVLVFLFVASILMHIQGLVVLGQLNRPFLTMVGAFLGAGTEGILLFAVMALLLCQRRRYTWLARVSALLLGCTSVGAILSDFQFHLRTGGAPDMWVINSGVKDFHSLLKGEIASDAKQAFWNIFWAIITAAIAGCMVMIVTRRSTKTAIDKRTSKKQFYKFIGLLFLPAVLLYSVGAWMPIFNTYASLLGGFIFAPPGWTKDLDMALTIDKQVAKELDSNAPNVVLIVHESMSGEAALGRNFAAQAMPFFKKMMHSDDEGFYVFENSRTVSGDTVDAFTAIASGRLPINGPGIKEALNTTIGNEFLKKGYRTVSISSRVVNFKNTKWFMLENLLKTNFGDFFGPTKQEPLVNGPAADDLDMEKYFRNWLAENRAIQQEQQSRTPFYAQFYYFNSHEPFVNHQEISNTTKRKIGMLSTVDRSIENLFHMLEESGELNNTIIIGTGDHGENICVWDTNQTLVLHGDQFYRNKNQPDPKGSPLTNLPKENRLNLWNSEIMHPLTYMYVPPSISRKNPELYRNLRHNTRQLTSTLDIFPTIMHILNGKQQPKTQNNMNCIRGVDLLTTKIPPNRMMYSFPGVLKNVANGFARHMAVHYGTSSTLYKRWRYFGFKDDRDSNLDALLYVGTLNRTETTIPPLTTLQEWVKILREMEGRNDENFEKITKLRHSARSNIVQALFEELGFSVGPIQDDVIREETNLEYKKQALAKLASLKEEKSF